MRVKEIISIIFTLMLIGSGATGKEKSTDDAVSFLKAACVLDEAYDLIISGDAGLKFLRPGAKGTFFIKESNIKGFVETLNDDLRAEQADKIRKCMQPYIQQILDAYLGTEVLSSLVLDKKPRSLAFQRIRYLEVTATKVRVVGHEAHVTLMFKVRNQKHGAAIAVKAMHSDGIADFWKFFPQPSLAELTDDLGGDYRFRSISGLGYARDSKDWMLIDPNGEQPVTLVFQGQHEVRGKEFILSFDIWTVLADENGKGFKSSNSLYLDGISRT